MFKCSPHLLGHAPRRVESLAEGQAEGDIEAGHLQDRGGVEGSLQLAEVVDDVDDLRRQLVLYASRGGAVGVDGGVGEVLAQQILLGDVRGAQPFGQAVRH